MRKRSKKNKLYPKKRTIEFIIIIFAVLYLIKQEYDGSISLYEELYYYVSIVIALCISHFTKRSILLTCFLTYLIIWIIFLNTNPYPIYANKLYIMNFIPIEYRPNYQLLLRDIDVDSLKFPIIVKPTICTKVGKDVERVNNIEELELLLQKINPSEFMVQNFLYNYPMECGVLYERLPWKKKGRVINIVVKDFHGDVRGGCDPCVLRNDLLTERVHNLFDNLAKLIPNFYVGRFDVRYHTDEEFKNGVNIKVVEVNGTLGFDLQVFIVNENESNIAYYLRSIKVCLRWFFVRMIVAIYNIITFNGYNPVDLVTVMFICLYNRIKCDDWEKQYALYS